MRAALLRELGGVPEPAEVEDPRPDNDGRTLVDVTAAGLNPLDIGVASGRFYGGSPSLPYIPGCEAVGRLAATGQRVYVVGEGLGVRRDGTLAERATVAEAAPIPLADDVPDEIAIACGIAGLAGWLPLAWRAPIREDDRVLVLGATGTAGLVAVQAARLLGAERVVAAGRNAERLARAREVGADETVDLGSDGLADAFRAAFGGEGPSLIVDPLWNGPLAAAVEAAVPRARIVQVGQSAGPEATLRSNDVRGKQLELFGYSNFAAPPDVAREGYLELLGHVAARRIRIDVETSPLELIADAWRRQAEGPGAKLVVSIS
jgi:NADPH2:quinone reductase